ncbi:MAG: ribose-phosphate diphosphokinase [Thermoplasmata archaeon]|nr:ribose-phosphate diphosphokinase [Thermoplasmata archaeon]NIS11893.1 ribose-phosphate diphosphokinase [Thermoplasmata archaeon]NIV78561.1 ribose-phosphate diphosphokinase [Thermoplasmata archaeon]NIW82390.1 ribose-phosphate diphosphokinase [Thermoplasmata archaeon]NIW88606.1 ribose-phosphate diphosphokinase [Thermoplasmata archaeon]
MKVLGGSASPLLATRLARELDVALGKVDTKRFPDGECYVRIHDDLEREDVILVQSTRNDEELVELLLLQDAIQEFRVRSLITVVPYFGYARQDKLFNKGEAISSRALIQAIQRNTDTVLLCDVHNLMILTYFDIPVENVSGMLQIAQYLKDAGVEMVLSPDEGSVSRARIVGQIIGTSVDYLEKTRIDGETVKITTKMLDVYRKRVAIVDDIIATGGTIVEAAKQLKDQGAKEVIAACTHGLFAQGALEKLEKVVDTIVSSDSIENETSAVSVAPELCKAIKNYQ